MAQAQELAWKTIDVATLPQAMQDAWAAKREADAAARAKREAFEAMLGAAIAASVPKGKRLVCGYRFGKLSVALAEGEAKTEAKPKLALTLTQALGL